MFFKLKGGTRINCEKITYYYSSKAGGSFIKFNDDVIISCEETAEEIDQMLKELYVTVKSSPLSDL